MSTISAVERGLSIPEILLNILGFVAYSDFVHPPYGTRSDDKDFEAINELSSTYFDVWVRCRSVSRYWKSIIENERQFKKYSWRGREMYEVQDSLFCYPALVWFQKALERIAHQTPEPLAEDYEKLSKVIQEGSFHDILLAEPPITDIFIKFGPPFKEIEASLRRENPNFVVFGVGKHGHNRGIFLSEPNGINMKDFFCSILHVLARIPRFIRYNSIELGVRQKKELVDHPELRDEQKRFFGPSDYFNLGQAFMEIGRRGEWITTQRFKIKLQ